jgi:hypothetical protein
MYTISNATPETVVLSQPEFDMLLDLAHPVRNGETKPVTIEGDYSKIVIEVAESGRPIRYREQTLAPSEAARLVFSAIQKAYGRV